MKRKTVIWTIIFVCLLMLTQLCLILPVGDIKLVLGLPQWVWLMIGVHIIYIVALAIFSYTNFNEDQI